MEKKNVFGLIYKSYLKMVRFFFFGKINIFNFLNFWCQNDYNLPRWTPNRFSYTSTLAFQNLPLYATTTTSPRSRSVCVSLPFSFFMPLLYLYLSVSLPLSFCHSSNFFVCFFLYLSFFLSLGLCLFPMPVTGRSLRPYGYQISRFSAHQAVYPKYCTLITGRRDLVLEPFAAILCSAAAQ